MILIRMWPERSRAACVHVPTSMLRPCTRRIRIVRARRAPLGANERLRYVEPLERRACESGARPAALRERERPTQCCGAFRVRRCPGFLSLGPGGRALPQHIHIPRHSLHRGSILQDIVVRVGVLRAAPARRRSTWLQKPPAQSPLQPDCWPYVTALRAPLQHRE